MPRFSRLRTEPFALGLSTSLLLVPPALAETEEAQNRLVVVAPPRLAEGEAIGLLISLSADRLGL